MRWQTRSRSQGEVLRPGVYAWHPGMHLTELLTSLSALKEDADQRYVLIRRESYPGRRVSVLSADAVQCVRGAGDERRRGASKPRSCHRSATETGSRGRARASAAAAESPRLGTGRRRRSSRRRANDSPGTYPLQPGNADQRPRQGGRRARCRRIQAWRRTDSLRGSGRPISQDRDNTDQSGRGTR